MREGGRSIWLGTIQFSHLRCSKAARIEIMQHEVRRIYCLLLTNLFRKPRKIESADLPILIGSPDNQVSKHKPTTRLSDMLPNEGMHYHFLLAVPAVTRQKSLEKHVIEKNPIYLGQDRIVTLLDLRPMPPVYDEQLADYTFKHIKRNTYTTDDILILPEGRSEGKREESRRAVRVTRSHPMPDELRAGFLRLLTSCKPMLLVGNSVMIRLEDGPAILSILPFSSGAAATGNKWKGTESNDLRTGEKPFTLGSATLFVRGAGQKTTAAGESHVVLWDLEVVFAALVVRDRQFQTTPAFKHIARSLVPLVRDEYVG